MPDTKIIIGIWSKLANVSELSTRLGVSSAVIATNLKDAISIVKDYLVTEAILPLQEIDNKTTREELNSDLKLRTNETQEEDYLDSTIKKVAKAFDVPLSLVMLIDLDSSYWESRKGLPASLNSIKENGKETSIFGNGIAKESSLVIEDLKKDSEFANHSWVRDRGVRFYGSVPLKSVNGHIVGTLAVIDTKPRKISEQDKQLLESIAEEL